MLDEILLIGPSSKNSYYFQIVPLFLSIVGKETELPGQGTTYRFSVHKGTSFLIEVTISLIKTGTQSWPILTIIMEQPECQSLCVN